MIHQLMTGNLEDILKEVKTYGLAVRPPSTINSVPVIKLLSSLKEKLLSLLYQWLSNSTKWYNFR